MNRPLKFRIWNKATKKFLDNSASLHCYSQWMIDAFTGEVWDAVGTLDAKEPQVRSLHAAKHYMSGVNVIKESPMVVQQFTGLFDFKGTEIYEGDIVKSLSSDDKHLCKMVWVEYDARYGAEALPRKDFKGHLCTSYSMGCSDWEIVGNIFENPELLNGY